MAMTLAPAPLVGRFVRLEPFGGDLREPVRTAISRPDPIWPVLASSAEGDRFEGWWASALAGMASGGRIPYAVRRLADDEVVGSTSFLNIDVENRGLEIGSTFLRPEARAGAVNPDMKLAMLGAAFAAGALRVELRTDGRNLRSQAAIAKLGAVREGEFRKQKRLWTGEWRSTVVYAVTDDDWPGVRARLEARLDAFGR